MERQTTVLAGLMISTVFLGACTDGSDGTAQRMFVEHYKSGCEGVGYGTCLLTREAEQSRWGNFHDSIIGFDYEWGFQYELRVRVTDVPNPLEDQSSIRYSLLEVVSKEPVPAQTPFDFILLPVEYFSERLSDTDFTLGSEPGFTCDVATCDSVESLLTQEMAMLLEFHHADEPSGPLQLQRILCSDTEAQFSQSCLQ